VRLAGIEVQLVNPLPFRSSCASSYPQRRTRTPFTSGNRRGRQQLGGLLCELCPYLDDRRPDINFGNAPVPKDIPFEIYCRDQEQRKPRVRYARMARGLAQRRAFAMPMNAAEEYRLVAWDCLKMAEVTSHPETLDSLLNLAERWARMAEQAERNERYRAVERDRRAA
jgi:hypothetical protein